MRVTYEYSSLGGIGGLTKTAGLQCCLSSWKNILFAIKRLSITDTQRFIGCWCRGNPEGPFFEPHGQSIKGSTDGTQIKGDEHWWIAREDPWTDEGHVCDEGPSFIMDHNQSFWHLRPYCAGVQWRVNQSGFIHNMSLIGLIYPVFPGQIGLILPWSLQTLFVWLLMYNTINLIQSQLIQSNPNAYSSSLIYLTLSPRTPAHLIPSNTNQSNLSESKYVQLSFSQYNRPLNTPSRDHDTCRPSCEHMGLHLG